MRTIRVIRATAAALCIPFAATAVAAAFTLAAWTAPVSVESIPGASSDLNSPALEGCPFVSQRGDVLYFASNRAGGMGGLDIWYSARRSDGSWGNPVNFAAVNTPANELCPMAHRNGKTFLFVSARPGGCGGDDLYVTRRHRTRGWTSPVNLGCTVNSPAGEASPTVTDTELYFSSTRAGAVSDLYVSAFDGWSFGTPAPVAALNSGANDSRPNVRRDGLEIYFDSDRPGGAGGIDIWASSRVSASDPWSAPVNLSGVNSAANDLRATLSWDARTMYFGSTRAGGEGSQDLYVSTR